MGTKAKKENVSNIVKSYELSLCKNEQRKIDDMIRQYNHAYNFLLGKSIKIFKSKIYSGDYHKLKKEEKWAIRDRETKKESTKKTLIFVDKKGNEVRGFNKGSFVKYLQKLYPNCLFDAEIRNKAITNMWSAWDEFFNDDIKNLPKFHSYRKGNISNSLSYNYGVPNYRKGYSRYTFIINKEDNTFCIDFNRHGSKSIDKRKIIKGSFKFKTNKNKKIGFRDNKKKFEWFDKDLDVCTFAIVRKEIRGKYRYFLNITYQTESIKTQPIDYDLRVGIDINLNNYAIYSSQNGCWGIPTIANEEEKRLVNPNSYNLDKTWSNETWYQKHIARIKTLQRKLDKEERLANPNSYNSKGQIYRKLYNITPRMKLLMKKKRIEFRRITECRKNYQGWISNTIISLHPSVICWEGNHFQLWAKRAKECYGKRNKKKRYGAQIHKTAPYGLKIMLKNKCKANGINFIEVNQNIGCTRFDCTNGEKNPDFANLSNRTHRTSDGIIHSRDLISAYNISCCSENEIDKDLALRDYHIFCEREKREIERLRKNGIKNGLI